MQRAPSSLASLGNSREWHNLRPEVSNLYGVYGNESGLVLAVGECGAILRSEDWGENWQIQIGPNRCSLYDVWIGENGEAFATGDQGTILYSDDSGQTWQTLPSGITSWLHGLWVHDR